MSNAHSTCSSPGALRVFICVNGILTLPDESEGWTDRAVTWLHTHTDFRAEKFEYACGAITRRLRQQWRAQAIAKMCAYYFSAGYEVSLVGHSNGCDLIARVLALVAGHIRSVHLFAAAADWQPFSLALHLNRVARVHLYVSDADRALLFAGLSRNLLGWLGLGYGDLGRTVPAAALRHPKARVNRNDTYGHSSWFERGTRFEATMNLLISHEQN
ncbi:MAG TPA: hypothetical protein VHN79_11030 [Lacunisphaera sp.]|nr:hypothetical protein [Lacunisphaera sp.]